MGRDNILKYQQEYDESVDEILKTENYKEVPSKVSSNEKSSYPFSLCKNSTLKDFLKNNKYFADSINSSHPEIFPLNGQGQSPHTLWIGCSDSRAGDACLHTLPGEVFTHRNIANIISSSDISSQGVIQFAVEVLKVKKIIVCGHTDCGGIWASLSSKKIGGVLDSWLHPVRQVRENNIKQLQTIKDPKEKAVKLSELNVINSVQALRRHPSALSALKKGEIEVWGLIYDVSTGLLKEVEIPEDSFIPR